MLTSLVLVLLAVLWFLLRTLLVVVSLVFFVVAILAVHIALAILASVSVFLTLTLLVVQLDSLGAGIWLKANLALPYSLFVLVTAMTKPFFMNPLECVQVDLSVLVILMLSGAPTKGLSLKCSYASVGTNKDLVHTPLTVQKEALV